ncbi:MAG: hypothetical protein IJ111_03835 [Eggerthellaceae bacterium]|nr:hypothetical protein [Eggerthellaceae bacterium]
MPKTRLQECAFTVLMTFVMVYAMVCFNIAISQGAVTSDIFALALEEMLVMWPIAIVIDLLVVSRIAGKAAGAVARRGASQRAIVFAISGTSVLLMCPLMSLAACLIVKGSVDANFWLTLLQLIAVNYPIAALWQFLAAGPAVRFAFGKLVAPFETAAA